MKLSAREAARLLAISESELYRLVDAGAIPCHLVNKQPLFSHVELLEWATVEGRPLAGAMFDETTRGELAAAIEVGGVHPDVPGDDVASVLAAVVDRLPIEQDDREMVLAILLARESEASTGVGNGIAIPHVRTPLVFAERPAAIAVCFLTKPVPFAAIDDQPIHTVFAMMTPTIDGHLQLLARLAIALHDAPFVDAIQRRAGRDELIEAARSVESRMSGPPA